MGIGEVQYQKREVQTRTAQLLVCMVEEVEPEPKALDEIALQRNATRIKIDNNGVELFPIFNCR